MILCPSNRIQNIRRGTWPVPQYLQGGRMVTFTQCRRVLGNAFTFLHHRGPKRFASELWYRIINAYHECRLGIKTDGMIKLADLGIHNDEFVEYTPIGYIAIQRAFKMVPIPASSISFLDLGCGKGRAIAVAASHAFNKVRGVEISPELCRLAKKNIDMMRYRRTHTVEVIKADAADFVIPEDVNLIFLFNPFLGKTLARVIDNVHASYTAQPRRIYLIYFNKIHFERFLKDTRNGWIRPTHYMYFYPSYSCGIYEIGTEGGSAGNGHHWNLLMSLAMGYITNLGL